MNGRIEEQTTQTVFVTCLCDRIYKDAVAKLIHSVVVSCIKSHTIFENEYE